MAVTYTLYPTLLHTSFTRKDAPADLPFEVETEELKNALVQNKAFMELLPTIAILNELAPARKNYFLPEKDFTKIEYHAGIREKHFLQFQKNLPKSVQYGSICFQQGGQYLYLYLDAGMANKLRKVPYPYLCTTFIAKDFFVGIEEAYFTDQGISIEEGGIYSGGMDKGGYVSFVIISLDYLRTHKTRLMKGENRTKEAVYTL